MSVFDERTTVRDAREAALLALASPSSLRLALSLWKDKRWVATSPDLEWLIVTASSKQQARSRAIAAVIRVATWCGANVRIFPT